ncbi:TetR/AcrR family transcriptional regulator (plasmid) [Deinococcus taeanensis]|uniref:TetR/AcrR family transcriptional regulator n=1 Tax=Deinococcus taeanensis TaxID=2737050 RepID=UPI001CDD4251|nr:TetR/AcrR family transcriptional regulator [Deinococcus taeanensis]UBV44159.1 TetR/AcrR family transcriptional regulator [Deinococcus taeanensis]
MRKIERPALTPLHPQTRRHLENGQRLRLAAIREFAQHGLHGAKVSNIVAAAHLTQPSFYRTWPSKEAAYEDLITATIETWQASTRVVLDGPDEWTFEQRLSHGIDQLFRLITLDRDLTRLVLNAHSNDPDWLLPFIHTYEDLFQRAQRRGWVTTRVPAEVLAQAVFALLDRFFQARLYRGAASVEDTTRELTQLILPMVQEAHHD